MYGVRRQLTGVPNVPSPRRNRQRRADSRRAIATRIVRSVRPECRPARPLRQAGAEEAPRRGTPRRVARALPRKRETGARRSAQLPAGAWNGAPCEPPGRLESAPQRSGPPVCVVTNVPGVAPGRPIAEPKVRPGILPVTTPPPPADAEVGQAMLPRQLASRAMPPTPGGR